MDIGSKSPYPASALSNFAPHAFKFEGVEIASMEGFLQSLKFDNYLVQVEVCKLVGYAAKLRGRHKKWQRWQKLYWQGHPYRRLSLDYQDLLTRAYTALFDQSPSFRQALLATGQDVLTHLIGRTDPTTTILTAEEFCSRLMALRSRQLCSRLIAMGVQ